MSEELRSVSDHWWWRPGWSEGKRFYTWHFTFEGQTALHEMAREYQRTISKFPFYDLVPLEWLHLTTQEVGFTDRVPADHVQAIVKEVEERLAAQKALKVAFGAPLLFSEAIASPIAPALPVREALEAVRCPRVEADIRYVDLIRLGRDRRVYEWELVGRVAFKDED